MRLRALLTPPLVVGLVWVTAIWWPAQKMIDDARSELASEQTRQLALVETLGELDGLSDITGELEADLGSAADALPATLAVDEFVGQLAAHAAESGVTLRSIAPGDLLGGTTSDPNRPIPAGMTALSISLNAEGEFEQVMDFVDRLDGGRRLVVVDEITLSAVDGISDAVALDVTLRIFRSDRGETP